MNKDHLLGFVEFDGGSAKAIRSDVWNREVSRMLGPEPTKEEIEKQRAVAAFETGNHKLPDGSRELTQREIDRAIASKNASAGMSRIVNTLGAERGLPGAAHTIIDPFAGTEVVTVAVNLRMNAADARELREIVQADPERFQRFIRDVQAEVIACLDDSFDLGAQPIHGPEKPRVLALETPGTPHSAVAVETPKTFG